MKFSNLKISQLSMMGLAVLLLIFSFAVFKAGAVTGTADCGSVPGQCLFNSTAYSVSQKTLSDGSKTWSCFGVSSSCKTNAIYDTTPVPDTGLITVGSNNTTSNVYSTGTTRTIGTSTTTNTISMSITSGGNETTDEGDGGCGDLHKKRLSSLINVLEELPGINSTFCTGEGWSKCGKEQLGFLTIIPPTPNYPKEIITLTKYDPVTGTPSPEQQKLHWMWVCCGPKGASAACYAEREPTLCGKLPYSSDWPPKDQKARDAFATKYSSELCPNGTVITLTVDDSGQASWECQSKDTVPGTTANVQWKQCGAKANPNDYNNPCGKKGETMNGETVSEDSIVNWKFSKPLCPEGYEPAMEVVNVEWEYEEEENIFTVEFEKDPNHIYFPIRKPKPDSQKICGMSWRCVHKKYPSVFANCGTKGCAASPAGMIQSFKSSGTGISMGALSGNIKTSKNSSYLNQATLITSGGHGELLVPLVNKNTKQISVYHLKSFADYITVMGSGGSGENVNNDGDKFASGVEVTFGFNPFSASSGEVHTLQDIARTAIGMTMIQYCNLFACDDNNSPVRNVINSGGIGYTSCLYTDTECEGEVVCKKDNTKHSCSWYDNRTVCQACDVTNSTPTDVNLNGESKGEQTQTINDSSSDVGSCETRDSKCYHVWWNSGIIIASYDMGTCTAGQTCQASGYAQGKITSCECKGSGQTVTVGTGITDFSTISIGENNNDISIIAIPIDKECTTAYCPRGACATDQYCERNGLTCRCTTKTSFTNPWVINGWYAGSGGSTNF